MINTRRIASTSLSAKVIDYLRKRGYSQVQIARMLHVSEGYVSLVKSRERGLTLDHLELLSMSLSVPLGALLLAVTRPKKMTKRNKEIHRGAAEMLHLCDKVTELILKGSKPAKRKSA